MRLLLTLLLFLPLLARAQKITPWELEPSETTADLRGVHAVGGGVVWASGTNGTVLRSQDSGFEWQGCAVPPGAEKLDFRAIWAWDDQTAVVMSSGPGALSRVYKTTDGCAHWTLLFTNPEKNGFWDNLLFIDRERGLIVGDPSETGLPLEILATGNGGRVWAPVMVWPKGSEAPESNFYSSPGEALFAASNSAAIAGFGSLWIGTNHSRVLHSEVEARNFSSYCAGVLDPKYGTCPVVWKGWSSAKTALPQGNSSGIFSLAFRGTRNGLAVGGDYTKPSERAGTAAWSSDYGLHWTASATPPGGYRSAVAWDADLKLWITVGPNGSDISRDDGRTWIPLEHAPAAPAPGAKTGSEWNALSLPWAVGPHGRIGKLNPEAVPR